MDEEQTCPRGKHFADDVWMVRRNGKLEMMCPGCLAEVRRRGDHAEVVNR